MFLRALAFVMLLAAIVPPTVHAQTKTDKKLRATMAKSYDRLRSAEQGLIAFDKALAGPSSAVTKDDRAHYQWLLDVRGRLSARYADLRQTVRAAEQATPGAPANEALIQKIAQMNAEFHALQEAVQMESRRFQTLSNASKARHQTAMNAIRNMKG